MPQFESPIRTPSSNPPVRALQVELEAGLVLLLVLLLLLLLVLVLLLLALLLVFLLVLLLLFNFPIGSGCPSKTTDVWRDVARVVRPCWGRSKNIRHHMCVCV